MPFKRRRFSYRRRRTTRRIGRKRYNHAIVRAWFARRRHITKYRRRRFGRKRTGRFRSGRWRRNGIIRRGIVANAQSQPKYQSKHSKRQWNLSKTMQKRVDNYLGDKYFIRGLEAFQLDGEIGEGFTGKFKIFYESRDDILNVRKYIMEQQSRKWAQGGTTSGPLAPDHTGTYAFNLLNRQSIKINKIAYKVRMTNTGKIPCIVRFTECGAKRDIPASMGTEVDAGAYKTIHPLLPMLEYFMNNSFGRQGAGDIAPNMTAPYNVDFTDYTMYQNPLQSLPHIKYFFWFKTKKECRVEPGAYVDWYFDWTPKMQINRHMFCTETEVARSNNPETTFGNAFGYAIWKGLNDRAIIIETRGVGTVTTVTDPAGEVVGNSYVRLLGRLEYCTTATLSPLKFQNHYNTNKTTWPGASGTAEFADPTAKVADEEAATITSTGFT